MTNKKEYGTSDITVYIYLPYLYIGKDTRSIEGRLYLKLVCYDTIGDVYEIIKRKIIMKIYKSFISFSWYCMNYKQCVLWLKE